MDILFIYPAEREGFEPPVPFSTSVFKTDAIDHSAIFPSKKRAKVLLFSDIRKYLRTFFDYLAFFRPYCRTFSVSREHLYIVRQSEQPIQR